MAIVSCPIDDCSYKTEDVGESVIVKLLEIHMLTHSVQKSAKTKGPKLTRPSIDIGANEEAWNAFIRRWETFMKGSNISESEASAQLFECASYELSDLALRLDTEIASKSTEEIMSTLHSLAVIPVAKGVIRAELMKMEQQNGENFRTFAARVKGKAETCGFNIEVPCVCGKIINAAYTNETMKDVLLAGISDMDIRREALSCVGLLQEPINELVAFVERREMSRSAVIEAGVSTLSTFKREKNFPKRNTLQLVNRQEIRSCPLCNNLYKVYKKGKYGWNRRPYPKCFDCWKKGAASQNCVTFHKNYDTSAESKVSKFVLSHRIFENDCWRKATISSHPRVTVKVSHLKHGRKAYISAIADTGAQSNLWGYSDFVFKGFSKGDLEPVTLQINAANNQSLNIIGAFRAKFEGTSPKGKLICCYAIIYVSDSVTNFYLSCHTMRKLAIIGDDFPTIGDYKLSVNNKCVRSVKTAPSISEEDGAFARFVNAGCSTVMRNDVSSCKCPQRECVPPRPKILPFKAIPENNDKMRQWLLDRFRGSTFNTCPHRPLQQMAGPPLEMHISDSAKPRVCNTASSIPLHWQQRVYEDLIRDEALGVIERVPYGVPVTWCHRMVVTRKHDGTPRRTVDLSPLNKFCKRELHSAESPFHLARRIPQGTWKTVTDAWNGYHSVPLRECDSHLTSFITPFGRWRYIRAPQGFLSSGDGYNRRFEAVLADFVRKERCVDDTIHYDSDLEAHWWRTIDFLILVGTSGIDLNPDKFQFAQKIVEFAGFRISENNIEPLPKFLDAITTFPTPVNNTDIRSWYGLINQVGNYAQLRDTMAPFRRFLSTKTKFEWSKELDKVFEESKLHIVESIKNGVKIFDITKPTCLRPDYSTRGLGYFLLQKHCSCEGNTPQCCPDGWKITLAGSRFLQKAEERYAAIEGEALAIAWGWSRRGISPRVAIAIIS